jgi:hypothetical protein
VHVVCAEHGEVEDVPRAVSARARDESASKVAHAPPAPPDEHQACELPPGLTSGAVTVSSPTVTHPAGGISFFDPQPPEGVPGRTGPPLLQEAPKLSPPRA